MPGNLGPYASQPAVPLQSVRYTIVDLFRIPLAFQVFSASLVPVKSHLDSLRIPAAVFATLAVEPTNCVSFSPAQSHLLLLRNGRVLLSHMYHPLLQLLGVSFSLNTT